MVPKVILKGVSMLRFSFLACAAVLAASPGGFTFVIGSPVAAQEFAAKTAAFAFRTDGCTDPAKAQISATAEGLVGSDRRSVALKIAAMSKPGVYVVYQSWPAGGAWVVNLKGTCSGEHAGAVVPIGPRGFIRESAKFFPRAATNEEIDAALKALPQGGGK
jgi:hypothetical protein